MTLPYDRAIVRNILEYHSASTNGNIVTDFDAPKHSCSRVNADIITNSGTATFSVAQCYQLEATEVFSNTFCIQICSIIMLKKRTFPDMRTGDMKRGFWRKQPFDEDRYIFSHSIVEKVAECLLACTDLDECHNATRPLMTTAEICIYSVLVHQIQNDMRQHS